MFSKILTREKMVGRTLISCLSIFSGEFVIVNKHLLHDLTEMGLWSPSLKNKIIYEDGSVQKMSEIPDDLKAIYKYELDISIFYNLSSL